MNYSCMDRVESKVDFQEESNSWMSRSTDVRFWHKGGQIRLKWNKPGFFSYSILSRFGSASQIVPKSDLKNPRFLPFAPDLTHCGAKCDTPELNSSNCLIELPDFDMHCSSYQN